jgi:hypothetical protein
MVQPAGAELPDAMRNPPARGKQAGLFDTAGEDE